MWFFSMAGMAYSFSYYAEGSGICKKKTAALKGGAHGPHMLRQENRARDLQQTA
jgi:hypothetical protein